MIPHPLITFAAGLHAIEPSLLLSPSRRSEVVRARYVAIWLLAQDGHYNEAIGRFMNRDGSTIGHALNKVATTPPLKAHCERCRAQLMRMATLADAGRPQLHLVGMARKGA